MYLTGKTKTFLLNGREFTFFNQNSEAWRFPYPYEGSDADLHSSGCGIFSVAHIAQCILHRVIPPELIAHFSLTKGGRGDDGTDRPLLLRTMEAQGFTKKLGFKYYGEDLRNDLENLYDHLLFKKGYALCNLRDGHIVALLDAREKDGIKQVLAVDSVAETNHPSVFSAVCQVLPQSMISSSVFNGDKQFCYYMHSFAAYWVKIEIVKDFNLLHLL